MKFWYNLKNKQLFLFYPIDFVKKKKRIKMGDQGGDSNIYKKKSNTMNDINLKFLGKFKLYKRTKIINFEKIRIKMEV